MSRFAPVLERREMDCSRLIFAVANHSGYVVFRTSSTHCGLIGPLRDSRSS